MPQKHLNASEHKKQTQSGHKNELRVTQSGHLLRALLEVEEGGVAQW